MTSTSYTPARAPCKGDPAPDAWTPGVYAVWIWVTQPKQALPYRFRLGGYRSLDAAKRAIDADRDAFRNQDWTLGGLIDLGKPGVRHYRIFVCDGWTEVS